MQESRDPRSVIDAAERAAAAGDYASAEQLLREAALLQEADLGPLDPDLANTLNNLGVVCEITNKPADAELCYRRAHEIATAVLPADHPFVATSRKNLTDFCEARGKPVESETPLAADPFEREIDVAPPRPAGQPQAVSTVHQLPASASPDESRRVAFGRPSLPFAFGAVGLCALVVVLVATRPWSRSDGQATPSPVNAAAPLRETPVPTREPVEPLAKPKEITPNNREPIAAPKSRATVASVPPTLVSANLCRALSTGGSSGSPSDWRCDPASRPVDSGSLFFYTRLKSARDTTVQHRWYHGDRLYQVVELRIRANQTGGYRTYSRYTVNPQSAGNWRVELRTGNGILLHEDRFVVR